MTHLRLLLVTARFSPYMGGIETHTQEVGRRLAAKGVDVTVLTSDPSGRLPTAETQEGVQIRRVRAWPAKRDYYFAPGVGQVIATGNWDLMHCQGCHTFVPPLAMAAAGRAHIPYLVTFHTGGHSSRLRNAVRDMQWTALRPLLVQAERWIGVSQYELDFFRARLHLPSEHCHLIPNGSDLPQLLEAVAPEPGLIMSVGRLERFKGHQRMIAAMPHVRDEWPNARLLILGHGPYEVELRRLVERLGVSNCVEIRSIPPSDRIQMAQTLARAALVVLLSEAESHPVAVMEALLLGRPVLVADTSGLHELAQRQLVRAIPLESSPVALSAAVADELRSPMARAEARLPTWDDCAEDLMAVYESVMTQGGGVRILMLAQFYAPIIGGEERVVQDLSQELASRGHSVAVTTLWHEGLPAFELDGAVRVYRIRSLIERAHWIFKASGRKHAPPWADPGLVKGLREVIRQEQPQVVHAHNWLVHSFLPLKKWSGARLVLSLHDYSLICAKKRLIFRDQPCDGPGLVKCLSCAADHYGVAKGVPTALATAAALAGERASVDMFLPVSQAVATYSQLDRWGAAYQVVPNFVPSRVPDQKVDTAPFLAQLPAGDFLLFVGDLSADKGLPVLLKAYANIPQAPPLMLIGRPVYATPSEMPPNVRQLGPWPHEAVLEAWRRCRMALVPSVWAEPFGLVALEAMAAGRPVIASRAGGLPDIVLDGETGVLVPPGDPVALRAAMARLLASPDLGQQMGQAGQQRVAAFQASVVLPRLEQAYQALIAKEGRPGRRLVASNEKRWGQPADG